MKNTISKLLTIILAAILLVGCGSSSKTDAKTVINIAYTTAWGGLNPYNSTSATMYEYSLWDKIYDRLAYLDQAGTIVKEKNASSWSQSDDGKTLTFKLNEKATWSDGEKVTAKDWVFTLQLLSDKNSQFTTRAAAVAIDGTDDNGVETSDNSIKVSAKDDYTLVIQLKNPSTAEEFLINYNRELYVLPEHSLKDEDPSKINDSSFWNKPVSSGPAIFKSQKVGSEIVLDANKNYELGHGNWDQLVLKVVSSSNVISSYVSGDIDFSVLGASINPSDRDATKQQGLTVKKYKTSNFFMEVLINSDTVSNKYLRQALHYALDKETIINVSAKDAGKAVYGYELLGEKYDDSSLAFKQDLTKVKSLLSQANYKGEKITMAIAEKRKELASVLQQQWKKAGINVELVTVDVATMFSGLEEGKYDLGISGHSGRATALWFESNFPANSAAAKSDKTRQDYVTKISSTINETEKVKLVKEYQKYLADQTYYLPLYYSADFYAESPTVTGISVDASLLCNDNVWDWKKK